jgi:hypothetical protein
LHYFVYRGCFTVNSGSGDRNPCRPGDLVAAAVHIVGSPVSVGSSENSDSRVSWSAWAVAPLYSCREHSEAESIIRVRNNPLKASSAICMIGTVSVCFAHVEQWVAAVELLRRKDALPRRSLAEALAILENGLLYALSSTSNQEK